MLLPRSNTLLDGLPVGSGYGFLIQEFIFREPLEPGRGAKGRFLRQRAAPQNLETQLFIDRLARNFRCRRNWVTASPLPTESMARQPGQRFRRPVQKETFYEIEVFIAWN